jgi:hypothetical protein
MSLKPGATLCVCVCVCVCGCVCVCVCVCTLTLTHTHTHTHTQTHTLRPGIHEGRSKSNASARASRSGGASLKRCVSQLVYCSLICYLPCVMARET